MDFKDFLLWEQTSRDTVDLKRIYIRMAGDLTAGVMLSQLVFYYLPGKDGRTRARIFKGDDWPWVAKNMTEWEEEFYITEKPYYRALKILTDLGIVEKKIFTFSGTPTTHLRLVREPFLKLLNAHMEQLGAEHFSKMEKSISPNGGNPILQNGENNNIDINIDLDHRSKRSTTTSLQEVVVTEKPKKEEEKDPAEKKGRKRTIRDEYSLAMEEEFCRASSLDEPYRRTEAEKREAGKRWNNPLWRMYLLFRPKEEREPKAKITYDEDTLKMTLLIIRTAVANMEEKDLNIDAPASIEKEARNIWRKEYSHGVGGKIEYATYET